MNQTHDLSQLKWTVSGWTPHFWRLLLNEREGSPQAEVRSVPAQVPGSVQQALRLAGVLPDWRVGENWRQCEWVENRHWIFEAELPAQTKGPGDRFELQCDGLDYAGWVYLDNTEIGSFKGTHIPHRFDLTQAVNGKPQRLRIIFDLPPRWLGQFGFSSQMRDWKARFNYSWDWQPRLVQIGIWDSLRLVKHDGRRVHALRMWTDADAADSLGMLWVNGSVGGENLKVRVRLLYAGHILREQIMPAAEFNAKGVAWRELPIDLWWPNGMGSQHLYDVGVTLLEGEKVHDRIVKRVGFRSIEWRPCEGAPKGADPWLCVINGTPTFLQGVNFPPLLPNFADATDERYRALLTAYRDLGANTLRVNGVGTLEKEIFYNLCDEMGLLVWQDVPLSGSGVDMHPPTDPAFVKEAAQMMRSFIGRRQQHPCLLMWCGGNELQKRSPAGYMVPLGLEHPVLAALAATVKEFDPGRRFLPTTATGPRFTAEATDFGKGLHWNTHGPWKLPGSMADWRTYWEGDDSLFRAESGAPGAAPVSQIKEFSGTLNPMPVSAANPAWRKPLPFWIEDGAFTAEQGRPPTSLEEYVAWSQKRQAEALSIAVGACKRRFPRCGGILLWCGHDCFPCPTNTSILDYHGVPKPAALALKEIWQRKPTDLNGESDD